MKFFVPFCLLLFMQLLTPAHAQQKKTFFRVYDQGGKAVPGTSEVATADNIKMSEVLSFGTSVSCGACTGTTSPVSMDAITFTVYNGPDLLTLKNMLVTGKGGKICFFWTDLSLPGTTGIVNYKSNYYAIVCDGAGVERIEESNGGDGQSVFQISIRCQYIAYYYRKPISTGQLTLTPTSVTTWNNESNVTTLPAGKAALPTSF